LMRATMSGRELIDRGYDTDVAIAAAYDASDAVPRLEQGEFRVLAGATG
jgi:phosphosulfolactate phosphohydrolase-like enzyme